MCPSRFCFTSMGSNPVGGAKLRKRAAFSSEARKGHGGPWKRTGVSTAGPAKDAVPQQKGASAAAGLQVDEVFRTLIVIHRVGKFSTILRPALLALPHTRLLGTTGF